MTKKSVCLNTTLSPSVPLCEEMVIKIMVEIMIMIECEDEGDTSVNYKIFQNKQKVGYAHLKGSPQLVPNHLVVSIYHICIIIHIINNVSYLVVSI